VRAIAAGRRFFRRKERTRTFKLRFGDNEADMKNQKNEKSSKRPLSHLGTIL